MAHCSRSALVEKVGTPVGSGRAAFKVARETKGALSASSRVRGVGSGVEGWGKVAGGRLLKETRGSAGVTRGTVTRGGESAGKK